MSKWIRWTAISVAALLAIAYPLLTAIVVIATANHYLLDVLAGGASVLTALGLQHALEHLLAIHRHRPIAVRTHRSHRARAVSEAVGEQLPADRHPAGNVVVGPGGDT